MFVYKLVLDKDSDFQAELNKFSLRLQSAKINHDDSKFLLAQVEAVVLQYQKHLTINNAKTFSMRRLFEGKGYKVTMSIGNTSKGIFVKMLELFRG